MDSMISTSTTSSSNDMRALSESLKVHDLLILDATTLISLKELEGTITEFAQKFDKLSQVTSTTVKLGVTFANV